MSDDLGRPWGRLRPRRRPRAVRRGVAAVALILVGAGSVPVLGGAVALAAETGSVTVSPALVYADSGQGAPVTFTASLPSGSTSANGLFVAVVSGPDADPAAPLAGSACSAPSGQTSPYAGPFSCPLSPAHGSGVDVVRVFDDTGSSSTGPVTFASGEPYADVTVVVAGAATALGLTPSFVSGTGPVTESATQNVCERFTATVEDAAGRPVVGEALTASAAQTVAGSVASTSAHSYGYFCDPASSVFPPATPGAATPTAGATSVTWTRTATFTTGDGTGTSTAGQVSFGVASDSVGKVTLSLTGGGLTVAGALTVTPGGATSAVAAVAVSPVTQTVSYAYTNSSSPAAPVAGLVSFTVTLTDGAGRPVGGATPTVSISASSTDAGAPLTCASPSGTASTDQTGTLACSYPVNQSAAGTPGSAGKDTIEVYRGTSAPTSCDTATVCASATVTITGPVTSVTDAVYCGVGTTDLGSVPAPCPVPVGAAGTDVSVYLSGETPGQTSPQPLSGYLVQINAVTDQGGPFTTSPSMCVTNSSGVCTATVTDAAPADGDQVTVGASFVSDPSFPTGPELSVLQWSAGAPIAGNLGFQAAASTLAIGSGAAALDDELTFTGPGLSSTANIYSVVAGRNAASYAAAQDPTHYDDCFYTTAHVVTYGTDSAGQCFAPYTDSGPTTAPGVDTVTASYTHTSGGAVSSVADTAITHFWVQSDATVRQLGLDMSNCDGLFTGGPAPYTPAGFDSTGAGNVTADPSAAVPSVAVTRVCAAVTDSGGSPLFGTPVTFSTTGTGVFTDPNGVPLTDPSGAALTSETVPVASSTDTFGAIKTGYAMVYVRSAQTGSQTVTATAGGLSASGQLSWTRGVPAVSGISPTAGSQAGGSEVTITGSNLTGATAVHFGTTPAQGFQVNTAGTQITAVSPPGSPGTVDVTVTSPAGTSPAGAGDRFSFTTAAQPQFIPISPVRVLDTRPHGPLAPGSTTRIDVTNAGALPIPRGATAVALNVTTIGPPGAGYLELGPDGFTPGQSSTVNFEPGTATANFVVVPLAAGVSDVAAYVAAGGSATNLAVDVFGYLTGTSLHSQAPQRIVDTRPGAPAAANTANTGGVAGPLAAGTSHSFTVAGAGGVPATGATAVLLNVTAVGPAGAGNLQVYPDGTTPTGSTLNFIPAVAKAGFVILELPADGKIDVTDNGAPANLLIDVSGYLDATTSLLTQTPSRVLDTRAGSTEPDGLPAGPLTASTAVPVQITGAPTGNVPAGAQAVLVSMIAVGPTQPAKQNIGNLRLGPDGGGIPPTSNINYVGTNTISGFAIVALAPNGRLDLDTDTIPANVVLDIDGWFPAPPS